MAVSHDAVYGMISHLLARPGEPIEGRLDAVLRVLCKHRAERLAQRILAAPPHRVRAGPFAGMTLESQTEGCLLPKALGCYEQDLHPIVQGFPDSGYDVVIDLGCAEGYYAVGLARLLPEARVHARDVDPDARRSCRAAAERNGVGDRVCVGGAVEPGDLPSLAGERTVVICDVEGDEVDLLDPAAAPALRSMDLLVEVHDDRRPGTQETLRARFEGSHDVRHVPMGDRRVEVELPDLGHLDRLLCVWEWRLEGNDWLWMSARDAASR